MDELGAEAEARGRPAVLLVDPPSSRVGGGPRALERGPRELLEDRRQSGGDVNRCRLVGHPDLEPPEPGVRPDVPPEARVVGPDTEAREAVDERLPVLEGL